MRISRPSAHALATLAVLVLIPAVLSASGTARTALIVCLIAAASVDAATAWGLRPAPSPDSDAARPTAQPATRTFTRLGRNPDGTPDGGVIMRIATDDSAAEHVYWLDREVAGHLWGSLGAAVDQADKAREPSS